MIPRERLAAARIPGGGEMILYRRGNDHMILVDRDELMSSRMSGSEEALATMIYLHDHYALDGRDPNTYSNILWCFGLHDRPWSERKIFGMTRYMNLEGMRRKTDVDAYLREIV